MRNFDDIKRTPRTVPLIQPQTSKTYTNAVSDVKNTIDRLQKEGYNVEIKEQDEKEYYEIILRINKD